MAGALGVNQRWLFTGVFALGAALAGLGGALAIPREPANLELDLAVVSDAFVVVVVGGLGSIPGAFLAALLIAEIKAFCIGLGYSKLTLVAEFIVMAVVLVAAALGPARAGRPARRAAPLGGALHFAHAQSSCLSLVVALALVPLLLGRIRAGAPHRRPGVRSVRGQPAFPARTGRHGVVRPRGVLRPRRLWRRPARPARRPADGACPDPRRRSRPPPARRCSAGSACGSPASTSRC